MKCFNCIDTVYMEDMGGGDWKCPVCGDEYNQYEDYDVYADPEPLYRVDPRHCPHTRNVMVREVIQPQVIVRYYRCKTCGFRSERTYLNPAYREGKTS